MPSPTYPVFDGDVAHGVNPRRPSINDVGGAGKQNHQAYPPDPVQDPTAEDDNQQQRVLVGLAAVCPTTIVQVVFTAGTPSAILVSSASTLLTSDDFTVTDNGTGDTSITCPSTKLPTGLGACLPCVAQAGNFTIGGLGIANGYRVTTFNAATGAAADCNFTLFWY